MQAVAGLTLLLIVMDPSPSYNHIGHIRFFSLSPKVKPRKGIRFFHQGLHGCCGVAVGVFRGLPGWLIGSSAVTCKPIVVKPGIYKGFENHFKFLLPKILIRS